MLDLFTLTAQEVDSYGQVFDPSPPPFDDGGIASEVGVGRCEVAGACRIPFALLPAVLIKLERFIDALRKAGLPE